MTMRDNQNRDGKFVMSDDLKEEVRKRFDAHFDLERLPLFAGAIAQLENAGHSAIANALKELMQDNAKRADLVRQTKSS